MKLLLKPKDIRSIKEFEATVKSQFNERTHVQMNHCVMLVNYSKELADMLRPFPPQESGEFELQQCQKCKTLFLGTKCPDCK